MKSHRALDCMQRKRQTRKFHPLEKYIKLQAKRESSFFQNRWNNLFSFDFISLVTGRAWKLREISRENQILNRFVIANRRISRWVNRVWWEKRIKKKKNKIWKSIAFCSFMCKRFIRGVSRSSNRRSHRFQA